MKISKPNCPKCNLPLRGTIDTVMGVALIGKNDNGEWEWRGDTDMCWDSQQSNITSRGTLVECAEGHTWRTIISE